MGGSSKKQTVGFWYELGQHLGLCHGPVDAVLEIQGGGRSAWKGEATTNTQIYVDAPNLFGGEEREGGIQAYVDVMMGGPTQTANSYLTAQQGSPQPAYRGILGLVFRRGRMTANNPYIKPLAVRVRRILQGWAGGSAWYAAKAGVAIGAPALVERTSQEDFDGGLTDYETVLGSLAAFSVVSDAFGPCIRIAGSGDDAIRRPITAGILKEMHFSFKAQTVGGDDFGIVELVNSSGSTVMMFNMLRELPFSAGTRRPTIWAANSGIDDVYGTPMGTTPPPAGSWYNFSAVYDAGAGAYYCAITNQAGATLSSTTIAVSAPPTAAYLKFRTQGTGGEGRFDNVRVVTEGLGGPISAMNPAHIVYECLTNPEWGMGYPTGKIDNASFTAAADTFHAEGLGLCMAWSQQDSIENFVQLVMDHAGAVCGEDPRTGLFKLKPIRADYTIGSLRVFSAAEGNVISLDSFERASVTETINELTVSYTDAATGKDGSVTVQQLANIQAQGAVVPQTRSYPGLPTFDLALRTAMRDLRAAASGLARVRLTVTRDAYDLLPGDVIAFAWPEFGIELMALRIGKVDYGSLTNGIIRLEAVEDVFGLPASSYVAAPPIGWVEPSRTPQASPAIEAFEVPYRELLGTLGTAETAAMAPEAGYVAVVATRSPGSSMNFELRTRTGTSAYAQAGNGDWCPGGTLADAIGPTDTTVELAGAVDLDTIEIGSAVFVGAEICRVDAVNIALGTLLLGRGCCDTVPAAWPAGTRVWDFDLFAVADVAEYLDGETVDAKVLTRTTEGLLAESAAPTDSVTLDSRAARPYPPGLLRVTDLLVSNAAYPSACVGALTVTWAHRDRVLQQDQLIDENDASIGPEAGTTYTVRFYLGGVLDATQTGITGTAATSYTLTGNGLARVEVEAVRDGLTSWQAATAEFDYLASPAEPRITDANDTRITDSGDRRITD